MYKHLPQIQEAAQELGALLRRERNTQRRRRIHMLFLIATGKASSRRDAAEHLAVHRNTIRNWLDLYIQGGLDTLLHIEPGGARPEQRTLSAPVLRQLKARLDQDGFESYGEAQRWLNEEFALALRYSTVRQLIRYRLGAKLKRARPSHVKKTRRRPATSLAC